MTDRTEWPAVFPAAAELLVRASNSAKEFQRPLWDFAVEIQDLISCGLTRTDLRWLECHGLVVHLSECSHVSSEHRQFRSAQKLSYDDCTCFALTPIGLDAARLLICNRDANFDQLQTKPRTFSAYNAQNRTAVSEFEHLKPLWNPELFRLTLGQLLVKEYKIPARNQQCILASFQEEDWPARIYDPLPPINELEPKRRLHDTIAALNQRQKTPLLRFSGDGTGRGVKWMLVGANSHFNTYAARIADDV
jgi:hypothetical protein